MGSWPVVHMVRREPKPDKQEPRPGGHFGQEGSTVVNNINRHININMWKDTRMGRMTDKASVGLSSGQDGGKPSGGVVPIRATVVFGLGLPGSSLVLPRPVYP